MAIRAGSYNGNPVWWRGVIYENSWGIWACTHRNHDYQADATRCAREALAEHRDKFITTDVGIPGWEPIGRQE
jgi:hypothetical protein